MTFARESHHYSHIDESCNSIHQSGGAAARFPFGKQPNDVFATYLAPQTDARAITEEHSSSGVRISPARKATATLEEMIAAERALREKGFAPAAVGPPPLLPIPQDMPLPDGDVIAYITATGDLYLLGQITTGL